MRWQEHEKRGRTDRIKVEILGRGTVINGMFNHPQRGRKNPVSFDSLSERQFLRFLG